MVNSTGHAALRLKDGRFFAQVLRLPQIEPAACAMLRLRSFMPTTLADYAPIAAMEEGAVRLGDPVLR